MTIKNNSSSSNVLNIEKGLHEQERNEGKVFLVKTGMIILLHLRTTKSVIVVIEFPIRMKILLMKNKKTLTKKKLTTDIMKEITYKQLMPNLGYLEHN